MSWLAGVATLSGPRWSAGAYWAEDGNAQPDDSDWADSSTWDAEHAYDAEAPISLGVFIHGRDVTGYVRSASWGVGQSEPLTSTVPVGSASLSIRQLPGGFDSAGFAAEGFEPIDYNALEVGIGSRVVIATEWDVLYVGQVESTETVHEVGRYPILTLGLVDDLTRALDEVSSLNTGGNLFALLDRLLRLSGVVGTSYTDAPGSRSTYPVYGLGGVDFTASWYLLNPAERTGELLELLSEALWACASTAVWTPAGLRVAPLALHDDGTYPYIAESFDQLAEMQRGQSIQTVRNRWVLTNDAQTTTETDTDSIATYGRRKQEVDNGDWRIDLAEGYGWQPIIHGTNTNAETGWPSYVEPITTMRASTRIRSTRHRFTRIVPFDVITNGPPAASSTTERYRVLRTQHELDADGWTVNIEGVKVGLGEGVGTSWVYPPMAALAYSAIVPVTMPAYLAQVTDGRFGTKIMRVSDNVDQRHRYSCKAAWSATGQYLLLDYTDGYRSLLDGDTYAVLQQNCTTRSYFTWSSSDDNVGWSTTGLSVYRHTISGGTMSSSAVADLSGSYDYLYLSGNGSTSNDGRYLALRVGSSGTYGVAIFDTVLMTVVAEKMWLPSRAEGASMFQSGTRVWVSGVSNGSGETQGMWSYPLDMSTGTRQLLTDVLVHCDMGRDPTDSYDVLVAGRYAYRADGTTQATELLTTANRIHVSCRNTLRPGYAYYSCYSVPADADGGNWSYPGYGDIWAVKTDGSAFDQGESYCQTHRVLSLGYAGMPFACPSPNGERVVFGSEWSSSGGITGGVYAFVAGMVV